MPLYKTFDINRADRILLWHITESAEELQSAVLLTENSKSRLSRMKSEQHRKAFLSVRNLLQLAGYSDPDLIYDQFGKPQLIDGTHISITHSHEYSAIIISYDIAGIDLELRREKIIKIADKFTDNELTPEQASTEEYISMLTVLWGAKESIFKIRNEQGISFKDHIQVYPFELERKSVEAKLDFNGEQHYFTVCFEMIENYILVYAFEKLQ